MTRRRKYKWRWRRLLSLGLAVLLFFGAVSGISALVVRAEDDKETVHLTFERGGIDATGIQYDTKGDLYTKEAFAANGLEIKLDFDSKISYQIFWYDENDDFKCYEPVSTASKTWGAPAYCKARIVIRPLWDRLEDDDEEIAWYEVWDYANQLEIRVNKNQKKEFECHTLTDGFFEVKEGYAYDTDDGFIQIDSKFTNDYDTYYFTNTGNIGSLYLNYADEADLQSMGIVLVNTGGLGGGDYYAGDLEANGGPLPEEGNCLFVPTGWSVYIYFDRTVVDAEKVEVYVY